jgi:hypothetical protein
MMIERTQLLYDDTWIPMRRVLSAQPLQPRAKHQMKLATQSSAAAAFRGMNQHLNTKGARSPMQTPRTSWGNPTYTQILQNRFLVLHIVDFLR